MVKLAYLIAEFLLIAAAAIVNCDYVRPQPRKLLNFPLSGHPSPYPQQVHISLAGEAHIRVSWITKSEHHQASSIVQYGTSTNNYTSVAQGETTSYTYLLYKSGKIHHTVIGPLKHDTIYYYRCGGLGSEFNFKTPPSKYPLTFAVAGDLGQSGWTKTTLEHIKHCEYDVYLLPGDLSYADHIQSRWDTFGKLVQPLASSRPWMVTEGNHEKESIKLVEDGFVSYNSRWKMPFEESGSSSNHYYSFDVAGVHVIMLSCYTMYDTYSDQYRWLKTDLLKVDRMKKRPWLVVVFHVPWYNSNYAHHGEGDNMMTTIEPLLYGASVDIVIAGHVHAYERSVRVYNGRLNPCGAVHITIGDGGNREGLAYKYVKPRPEWSVFREASFGHGELRIVNSTHAFWSWHRNQDDESKMSDQTWITSLSGLGGGCLKNNKKEEHETE
ncbi:purple acid phosphatase 18-like [Impatiens glandulifera]|uniref:purple acid phosphatase 18-like n=1 Tax=Impatiens glandulifera TaxID=253017 RepID=UPI001FB0B527|nr:purple acid phosphatase 18-like [Impatiens glandulifera]